RPPTFPRGGLRRLPGLSPPVSWSAAESLLACAQHAAVLQGHRKDARRSADSPGRAAQREGYRLWRHRQRRLQAQAAEDRERIAGLGLQHDLAAGLDLAVEAGRQRVGVLAARGADNEVVEAAVGLEALGLELLGKLASRLPRRTFDAHFPRREAAIELLLFPRFARRLVVPAILLVDPVPDATRSRLDAVRVPLGLDESVCLL